MKLNTFQKTAITTVGATLFLILVGGLVRAAGAGLGCPDWPKCFGLWIPPTSAADLPAAFEVSQFNVYKTWIEYLNRLVGVVIGLLITATFALSFRYRKEEPSVFYSSAAAFVLVLVQGWLGGLVVKSALSEWLITIHMLLAMVIVNILLYATFKATQDLFRVKIRERTRKKMLWIVWVLLVFTLIQLVLGTQVREGIDIVKDAVVVPPRSIWISQLGSIFEIHRSFSWLILFAGSYLYFTLYRKEITGTVKKLGQLVFLLILVQIAVGVGLDYLHMPRVLQVLHLVGISLMVCSQFLLILVLGISASRE